MQSANTCIDVCKIIFVMHKFSKIVTTFWIHIGWIDHKGVRRVLINGHESTTYTTYSFRLLPVISLDVTGSHDFVWSGCFLELGVTRALCGTM